MTEPRQTEILCPVQVGARKNPEASALVWAGGEISYKALDQLVAATAQRMVAQGIREGTRIAMVLPNGWRYIVLLMAAMRLGAVACPLSTRLPASGVRAQQARLRAGLLVTGDDAGWEGVAVEELVLPIEGAVLPVSDVLLSLYRPATIVFTSGSTAVPKGAVHTLGNHYYSARGSNENIRLEAGDRWLLSLPLYHVGGLAIVFRCLLAGATTVIPEQGESVAEAVSRYEVTHVSMVSTQLLRLLRQRDTARSNSLKAVLLGGSAMPPSLVEEALSVGLPIHTSYGLNRDGLAGHRDATGSRGRPTADFGACATLPTAPDLGGWRGAGAGRNAFCRLC